MAKFVPLPATIDLPHRMGRLLVERASDGSHIYTRFKNQSGKAEQVTHAQAVDMATHHTGKLQRNAEPLLFPPPLTIHHLMRERFETVMFYAEDGAFLTAANCLRQMAQDYEERHRESVARMAPHARKTA